MTFESLGLGEPILRAVTAEGYTTPTPIQTQSIPHVLAGHDLLGCAQTGTGKTAAFALPILHRLQQAHGPQHRVRPIRALVLSPTRELASQIDTSFRAYGRHSGLRGVVIYGGVNQNRQVNALHGGTDIVVATPGRLLDLMNQGFVNLSHVEIFVLDEADRMLDMGFIHDIRKIVAKLPTKRQTLFFSATMPPDIRRLADTILHKPVSVQVAPESATADNVEQSIYHVRMQKHKPTLLIHLLRTTAFRRSLVFTRTKSGANRVLRLLEQSGIASEVIHGNKSQNARARAIHNFKASKTHVLVATDIAARGLDIDDISHVVNYDLPNVPETYVHRIGRTARAGASGIAVSFCSPDEKPYLKDIERLIRKQIEVNNEHPEYPAIAAPDDASDRPKQSPIHNPRRPKQSHAQPRSHSAPRHQDTHAPRPARPAHGKPSSTHGKPATTHGKPRTDHARAEPASANPPHLRRNQPSRPAASHGHAVGAPSVGTKQGSRKHRRNRRRPNGGPRR